MFSIHRRYELQTSALRHLTHPVAVIHGMVRQINGSCPSPAQYWQTGRDRRKHKHADVGEEWQQLHGPRLRMFHEKLGKCPECEIAAPPA